MKRCVTYCLRVVLILLMAAGVTVTVTQTDFPTGPYKLEVSLSGFRTYALNTFGV